MPATPPPIRLNRAQVLTLWATVVAERLGYLAETALTLGRFVAGSGARAKARRLGISDEKQDVEERHARAAELKPLSTAPAGSARLACSLGVPETAATESPIPGVRCNAHARGDDFCGARHGQFGLERPAANNAISGQRDPV